MKADTLFARTENTRAYGKPGRRAAPRAATQEFALTPLQMGMVFESTLANRPWANLEQVVVHLDDEVIDPADLKRAWQLVSDRHDALRLSILWRDRLSPMQIVRPQITVDLATEDWSDRDPARFGDDLDAFLRADREQGVDLEKAPSWRVRLLHLARNRAVMVWTIHHALIDGRSFALVLDEVFTALRDPARLPPRPAVGFADYCRDLSLLDTVEAKEFFRAHLAGFDEPNALSQTLDGQPPRSARKALLSRTLPARQSDALRGIADSAGSTLANLMLASWGAVVSRVTGRKDAVIGMTRSGRHVTPGLDRTVGCLINTLPLRVAHEGSTPLADLLSAVRAATRAMHPFEHAALTDVRHWCGIPGNVPLFESMVMFERQSLTQTMRALAPEWRTRRVELHEEGAQPLTLAVYGDTEIALHLEYDPDSIGADRAAALLSHLMELLGQIATQPSATPMGGLSMLANSETEALMALARPDRAPDTAAVPCLATRIEAAAAASPDAPALTMMDGATLSYRALDTHANGLAHRLVAEGAGPGTIVAIGLERSIDYVIAMLAILKSGAAFLPVDPTYPDGVREHMLTDSGAILLIDRPEARHPADLPLILPEADPAAQPPQRALPDPDRLAYVIYTSGSTGKPKGVRVPMRAITAHTSAIIAEFGLTPQDRVLQFASLSFDVSIEEVIPTLVSGAHLILRNAQIAESTAAFKDAVAHHRFTVMNLPTAFWHVLVDDMGQTGYVPPDCVRLVIVGGERVSAQALAAWQSMVHGVRWLNGYGPTETTITCTLAEPGPQDPNAEIPIGRPTAHARAYILAADGSLMPRGLPGDLWIGGPAVTDGYINRPEETAKAFRPDPFAAGGRMYNSGDRAFWREDGTLGFLGRNDRQVKVRGFRIDLRHIERALERVAGVGRALAAVVDQGTPTARLAAWVAPAEGMDLPPLDQINAQIAHDLAAFMRPVVVPVDGFPRTAGGKIDMRALPQPAAQVALGGSLDDCDPLTRDIAAMMAKTLGLESIGPDDSFHDLGGHSLLAVQLLGRIEAATGTRLGIADLHRAPTPRGLAEALGQDVSADARPRYIIPIQPQGNRAPLFGVHVLGRNESFYRPLAAELGNDQPVLGLSVGLLGHDTPIGVEATAHAYFDDIQKHHPDGPINLAAVSLASYITFELARQLREAGREVRMVALFDAAGPDGRATLSGARRILTHLRLLAATGPGYMLRILHNKQAQIRHKIAKLRLKIESRNGGGAQSVETFVAANEAAVNAYVARPLDVPLTIIRAVESPFDSARTTECGLGWASVAAAGFTVIDNPGDHLSILQPPHVGQLAQSLSKAMGTP
ncbi:MAG: amino acid adenylation domain-containing protein [Paracoccaceae bacterium]